MVISQLLNPVSHQIGIMQGRLLPPLDGRIQAFPGENWRAEFGLAQRAALQSIEWIYDLDDGETNPLMTDAGVSEILALSKSHGVVVKSACADYFMARPLIRASASEKSERLRRLVHLMERCSVCGIERIVLPFVDASGIESDQDEKDVLEGLERVAPAIGRLGVELHLETSLPAGKFRSLLDRLDHPGIKVNYDAGNSASLGFDPWEEWAAYGNCVGSVHIKDRLLGGGTVPLGTGNVDFAALFSAIALAGYRGPWILQAARGEAGDELNWAVKSRGFLEAWLRKLG